MPYSTARIVIGAAMLLQVDAFHSVTSAPSFVRARSTLQQQRDSSIDYTVRYNLEQFIAQEASTTVLSVEEAASRHGMPWKTSMDPTAFVNEELLYMPFWEWQLSFLQENLTDLKVVSCTNGKTDFTYNENTAKKSRIVNLCLSSAEYRKIRLTYYDAGDTTQVYNAVLYPDPAFNLPVLGIDFLAFNRKKYLAICDFQPLHTVESDHDAEFSHLLRPIKESYSNLSGRMSSKFYDETQFFSQQMLFSRFEDESIIQNELIRACQGKPSSDTMAVLERQQAYDTYSAARDPATGLFTAMFGQEWAMDYVHDFLFSMSQRPAPGTPIVMPTMGGGNPQATAASSKPRSGGNPFATAPALTTQPQVAMAAR
jgi:15,16-dihydrobiliverdin:ferredoxin oxidoreductase